MRFFKHKPSIEGFDTETYKGNILLLTSSTEFIMYPSFSDILNFLWKNGRELNFFYNLGFDLSILVKPYLEGKKKSDLIELLKENVIQYNDYTLKIFGNKGFTLTKNKHSQSYFDISNFYSDGNRHYSLNELSVEILHDTKSDKELGIDRKKIGNEYGYFEKHFADIIIYGMKDSELTKRLSETKVDLIYKQLHVYPKSWYSNASISKSYLTIHNKDEEWLFWELIEKNPKAFSFIILSYYGGLFQARQLGYFNKVQQIDINSAYPDKIRNLYSIKNAKINYIQKPSKNCDYGFYFVKVKLNSLIPIKHINKLKYGISDEWNYIYMTAVEYWFWKKHSPDMIDFIEGYEIDTKKVKSFKEFENLYNERIKYKYENDINSKTVSHFLKIVMNATYGVFAQSKNGYTKHTNFVYSSYITALTRIQIYEKIFEIGLKNIISINTDSLIYKGNYKITDSKKLGEFGIKNSDSKGVFYMSGIYILDSELKKRGYNKLEIDTLLNAKNDTLIINRLKIMKLKEGIIQQKMNEIGDFREIKTVMDLKSNLANFGFPVKKLNFEYLNNHNIQCIPEPLIIELDWKKFDLTKYYEVIAKYKRIKKFLYIQNRKNNVVEKTKIQNIVNNSNY